MTPENLDPALRNAAIRSFRESLAKATAKNKADQAEVEAKEEELRIAKANQDSSSADCKAFTELIEAWSIDDEDDDDEEEHENEAESGSSGPFPVVRRRKGRLNARPKTLEVIRQTGKFVTVKEAINLVKSLFDEGLIKEKTIKNVIWDLTDSNELKKYYDKRIREYIYGLPEWFNADLPNPEFVYESGLEKANLDDSKENSTGDEVDEMMHEPVSSGGIDLDDEDDFPF